MSPYPSIDGQSKIGLTLSLWLTFIFLFLNGNNIAANEFHVATAGNDTFIGSVTRPWKTIQRAVTAAKAGDTILVHGGTYRETVVFKKSGDARCGPITLRNIANERVILDGSSAQHASAMIAIENQSHITLKGLEVTNLITRKRNETPVGILVTGACREITIAACNVHHIASKAKITKGLSGRDAHGIAVFGDHKTPITGLKILGNRVHDLTLGSSEALVVNGNIDGFEIRDNVVHDCDNIGIDCIGFEGVSPNAETDQVRNGVVTGNHVYNIATANNPSYNKESTAAGVYVDGGRAIVIERNKVHNCDFGIEIASEKKGKVTSHISVRNNILFRNLGAGLLIGGYNSRSTGDARDCLIANNTFFNNDTNSNGDEWGQIHLQYRVSNCSFINNVMHHEISKNGNNLFIVHWNKTGGNNTFDHNQFFGPAKPVWVLGGKWIEDWSDYQKHSISGTREAFGDPMFVSPRSGNWSLREKSPCIDNGNSKVIPVEQTDFAGNKRLWGASVDIGAIESKTKTGTTRSRD